MSELVLYVKKTCPWCVAAEQYLRSHGYTWREIDVQRDQAAFAEMARLSGQRLVPTLVVGEKILPDFGPDELARFLQQHGIHPTQS